MNVLTSSLQENNYWYIYDLNEYESRYKFLFLLFNTIQYNTIQEYKNIFLKTALQKYSKIEIITSKPIAPKHHKHIPRYYK